MNKTRDTAQALIIKAALTNMTVLGNIEYSAAIQQADLNCMPVINADAKVVRELTKAKMRLADLVFQGHKK